MSGALGSIGGLLAPIAGGFLGSAAGEGLGSLFGSTASSLLTPTILADIGGAVGGAGAGALANKNRGVGAALGGVEGLLTGPGLTNITGVASGLGGSNVTPFLTSLGGGGWGRTPAANLGLSTVPAGNLQQTTPAGQLVTAGNPNQTGPATAGVLPGAPGSEAAAAGTLTEGAPADQITALRNALYTGTGGPQALSQLAQLLAGTAQYAPALLSAAAAPKATVAGGPSAANVPAAQAGQPVPALGAPAAGTAGAAGGGVLGTGMNMAQLASMLGLGGAALTQMGQGGGANMPNYGQFNALAQQAMGNTGMANALRSGVLPPGAEQMAEAGLADSEAGIRARYASMGLSGSTMEGQDLARAQMQTEAQKYSMAQSAASYGMQQMQLADTIYGQIADYQLQQDKQLQDALAAFASAASGGSINYGIGGAANTNLNSLQPTGTGP